MQIISVGLSNTIGKIWHVWTRLSLNFISFLMDLGRLPPVILLTHCQLLAAHHLVQPVLYRKVNSKTDCMYPCDLLTYIFCRFMGITVMLDWKKTKGMKRKQCHTRVVHIDKDVKTSGDEGRCQCWCVVNKHTWSWQQNLNVTSRLLQPPPSPERSAEFCVVVNASCCVVSFVKANYIYYRDILSGLGMPWDLPVWAVRCDWEEGGLVCLIWTCCHKNAG